MTKAASCYLKDDRLYCGSRAETLAITWIAHPPFIRQDNLEDLSKIAENLKAVLSASIRGVPVTIELNDFLKTDKVGPFAPLAGYATRKDFTRKARFVAIFHEDGLFKFDPTRRRGQRFSFISDWSFSIPDTADDETLAKALLEALDRCET